MDIRGVCGECGSAPRVTTKGLLYKHGECPGGGQEPMNDNNTVSASAYATAEDIINSADILRKTGYTDEQLEKMLSDITPKRQKLRQAIRARVTGFIDNVRNYFNGAWDVFDDE